MNRFKTVLLSASVLMAACSAASAADVYGRDGGFKDEPYMPAITSWAGFYAGVHLGSTFEDDIAIVIETEDYGDGELAGSIDNALTGGIHVGYNWQNNSSLVLGVEAAIGLIDDEAGDFEITDYLASIRGRIGYGTDSTLVYATGGVAFLGYAEDFIEGADEETAVGFVVGGGIERKLNTNLSIGVEGLYYDFSSDIAEGTIEGSPADADLERSFWTAQVRLNYHLGGRGEALK